MGVFFGKKSGKWGCLVKKWTFPQRWLHYVYSSPYQYFLFYILFIGGGVRRHPTHPPAYGPVVTYYYDSRKQCFHHRRPLANGMKLYAGKHTLTNYYAMKIESARSPVML